MNKLSESFPFESGVSFDLSQKGKRMKIPYNDHRGFREVENMLKSKRDITPSATSVVFSSFSWNAEKLFEENESELVR